MTQPNRFRVACLILCAALASGTAIAGSTTWGIGIRQHASNPEFEGYAFTEDDLSYRLCAQYTDLSGFWQLVLNYTPGLEGTNREDYAITPEVDLLMTENAWELGIGVMKSAVWDEDGNREWTELYWQFLLGYQLRLAGVQIEANLYYPFAKFNKLDKFDSKTIEYGATALFRF